MTYLVTQLILTIYFSFPEFVWILTREREPSSETIDVAKQILVDNKVSQEYLSATVQQNCPQL